MGATWFILRLGSLSIFFKFNIPSRKAIYLYHLQNILLSTEGGKYCYLLRDINGHYVPVGFLIRIRL